MIETSTRPSNPSHNERSNDLPPDLSEEELIFYTSIKPDLNKIKLQPSPASVKKILSYSKVANGC